MNQNFPAAGGGENASKQSTIIEKGTKNDNPEQDDILHFNSNPAEQLPKSSDK